VQSQVAISLERAVTPKAALSQNGRNLAQKTNLTGRTDATRKMTDRKNKTKPEDNGKHQADFLETKTLLIRER
jgi:hypothetical protein